MKFSFSGHGLRRSGARQPARARGAQRKLSLHPLIIRIIRYHSYHPLSLVSSAITRIILWSLLRGRTGTRRWGRGGRGVRGARAGGRGRASRRTAPASTWSARTCARRRRRAQTSMRGAGQTCGQTMFGRAPDDPGLAAHQPGAGQREQSGERLLSREVARGAEHNDRQRLPLRAQVLGDVLVRVKVSLPAGGELFAWPALGLSLGRSSAELKRHSPPSCAENLLRTNIRRPRQAAPGDSSLSCCAPASCALQRCERGSVSLHNGPARPKPCAWVLRKRHRDGIVWCLDSYSLLLGCAHGRVNAIMRMALIYGGLRRWAQLATLCPGPQ